MSGGIGGIGGVPGNPGTVGNEVGRVNGVETGGGATGSGRLGSVRFGSRVGGTAGTAGTDTPGGRVTGACGTPPPPGAELGGSPPLPVDGTAPVAGPGAAPVVLVVAGVPESAGRDVDTGERQHVVHRTLERRRERLRGGETGRQARGADDGRRRDREAVTQARPASRRPLGGDPRQRPRVARLAVVLPGLEQHQRERAAGFGCRTARAHSSRSRPTARRTDSSAASSIATSPKTASVSAGVWCSFMSWPFRTGGGARRSPGAAAL